MAVVVQDGDESPTGDLEPLRENDPIPRTHDAEQDIAVRRLIEDDEPGSNLGEQRFRATAHSRGFETAAKAADDGKAGRRTSVHDLNAVIVAAGEHQRSVRAQRFGEIIDHGRVLAARKVLGRRVDRAADKRVERSDNRHRQPQPSHSSRQREEVILPVEESAVDAVCSEWMVSDDDDMGRRSFCGEPRELGDRRIAAVVLA